MTALDDLDLEISCVFLIAIPKLLTSLNISKEKRAHITCRTGHP
jgi:hypothetical protein